MVTRRLAGSISSRERPSTQTRTATVKELLSPSLAENDATTGWQVLLDFGGGEIKNAGCSASYTPVPGDTVVVSRYQNTLLIVDRLTAGGTGELPGGRVAYAYYDATVAGNYATAAAGAEVALPSLIVQAFMRNGAAYDVELFTGFSTAVANNLASFQVRKDTVTGTQLTEYFRETTTIAANVVGFQGVRQIRNDSGVDQNVVLVACMVASSTSAANAYANPLNKPWFEVRVKGASILYPHASALPTPPDFTG